MQKTIPLLLLILLTTPTLAIEQQYATTADLLNAKNQIIMEITDTRNEVNMKYDNISTTIETYKIELQALAQQEIKAQVDRIIISIIAVFFLAISIFLAFISFITIRKYEILNNTKNITGDELNETSKTSIRKRLLSRANKNRLD